MARDLKWRPHTKTRTLRPTTTNAQTEHFENLERYILYIQGGESNSCSDCWWIWSSSDGTQSPPRSQLGDGGQLALVLYVQVPVRVVGHRWVQLRVWLRRWRGQGAESGRGQVRWRRTVCAVWAAEAAGFGELILRFPGGPPVVLLGLPLTALSVFLPHKTMHSQWVTEWLEWFKWASEGRQSDRRPLTCFSLRHFARRFWNQVLTYKTNWTRLSMILVFNCLAQTNKLLLNSESFLWPLCSA